MRKKFRYELSESMCSGIFGKSFKFSYAVRVHVSLFHRELLSFLFPLNQTNKIVLFTIRGNIYE